MPASDDIREGMAEAFDVLSAEFLDGVTVKLLKVSEDYDEFDEVLEIESKRFFEYSNYRKNFLLEIADDSEALTEAVAEATHVKVDDTVYVIIAGDTKPPSSTDVTWKIFCDLFERNANTHYADL